MSLWKPVKGYEELYLVSDEGEVVALPREVDNGRGVYIRKSQYLKPFPRGRDGIIYNAVCLTKDGVEKRASVHRLVAEAFVFNPDSSKCNVVNHIDRDPLNNRADNLEWCDQQYNNEYGHNKRVSQYFDGEKVAEFKSVTFASEITGISRTAINNALKGCLKRLVDMSGSMMQKGSDDLSH